jgi:hypothetical protein
MMTALEIKLEAALRRVMAWAGAVAGDNDTASEVDEENESATQAYEALAEYNRQKEQEQNRVPY